jgi:hypothetical protein
VGFSPRLLPFLGEQFVGVDPDRLGLEFDAGRLDPLAVVLDLQADDAVGERGLGGRIVVLGLAEIASVAVVGVAGGDPDDARQVDVSDAAQDPIDGRPLFTGLAEMGVAQEGVGISNGLKPTLGGDRWFR